MRKIQKLEEGRAPARQEEEDRVFEKPIFTQLLTGPSELIEGQLAHFECRVLPVGDSSLRFEWYCNGKELKMGKYCCLRISFIIRCDSTESNAVYLTILQDHDSTRLTISDLSPWT